MIYQEQVPHPQLQAYVLNYWRFQVPASAGSQDGLLHTAPADAGVSLLLVHSPATEQQQVLLVGPHTKLIRTVVWPETIYLGIRFVPGVFASLFDDHGRNLKNQILPATDFVTGLDLAALSARLASPANDFEALEELLLAYVRQRPPAGRHPAVDRAVRVIVGAGGNVSIREVVAQAYQSERQLQKNFRRSTYLTMKELAGICRLRTTIIRVLLQKRSVADTIYEAGFFDQAHYNHALAQLTGQKPADFYAYIDRIEHVGVKPYHE